MASLINPVPGGTFTDTLGASRDGGARDHKGTDIFAPAGTPVLAPIAGTVVRAGDDGGNGGLRVWLQGDDGRYYYFAHLQNITAQEGSRLEVGQQLGLVGNTGNASTTAPHLHISINSTPYGEDAIGNPATEIDPNLVVNRQDSATVSATSGQQQFPGAEPVSRTQLPTDGVLINVNGTYPIFMAELEPGLYVFWEVSDVQLTDLSGRQFQEMSVDEFRAHRPIKGGDAAELTTLSRDYGTVREFWQHQLNVYMGPNPAKEDPSVRRVLARLVADPDMGPAELENLLKSTPYFQTRTQAQLEWNDLSDAERNKRILDTEAELARRFFEFVGREPGRGPTLRKWATDIASGAIGWGQAIEQFLKPKAAENPESPYQRLVRTEEETQRKRGVDIENTATQVRETYRRWGVPVTEEAVTDWAMKLVENRASEEDLLQSLKDQAATLYPWKDPEMETATVAEPYLQTYQRVLELPDPGLFDQDIQRALSAGVPLFEFERTLKDKPEWLETKNAMDDLSQGLGTASALMGFN